MLGRTHALTGLAASAALSTAVFHPHAGQAAVAAAVTAGAAVLPDIDHPDSVVSRSFGFVTCAFAHLVGRVSGGHRHGTHSVAGIAAFTAVALAASSWRHTLPGMILLGVLLTVLLAAALQALRIGGHAGDLLGLAAAAGLAKTGYGVAGLGWYVAVGAAAHIAGDMLTRSGCPLAWPLSERRLWLLPAAARLTTGKRAEQVIVTPVLLCVLVWMALAAAAAAHLWMPVVPGR